MPARTTKLLQFVLVNLLTIRLATSQQWTKSAAAAAAAGRDAAQLYRRMVESNVKVRSRCSKKPLDQST